MKISGCLLFVSTSCWIWPVVHSQACPPNVHGPGCKYLCHCSGNKCKDPYAQCEPGYSCAKGYFGPECNYRDNLDAVARESTVPSLISDHDDSTCLASGTHSVTIEFREPTDFTWMRVTTQPAARTIDVSFNPGILCTNKRLYMGGSTADITCDVFTTVTSVSVDIPNTNELCTIYISRGRNIAIGQATNQTGNYDNKYFSSFAVDGNDDSTLEAGFCSHTISPSNSRWSVFFDYPSIIVKAYITNRNNYQQRLRNFTLTTYNVQNELVETILGPNEEKDEYVVTFSKAKDITTYVRWLSIFRATTSLTICEMLVYGDFVCPDNKWGLDCSKTCTCAMGDSCFWVTGECGNGCATGKYGFNCLSSCPNNCFNNTCTPRYGDCYGCKPGYAGPKCETDCPPNCLNGTCNVTNGWCVDCIDGYYGPHCAGICPANCDLNRCHVLTGDCFVCEPGYFSNKCDNSCTPICRTCSSNSTDCTSCMHGTYGLNCSNNCSATCTNKSCDVVTGFCFNCTLGFFGDTCSTTCPPQCEKTDCLRKTGICLTCFEGFYGTKCEHQCNEHCKDRKCNAINGTCHACNDLQYGVFCEYRCASKCLGSYCNRLDGSCVSCKEGFYSKNCDVKCPNNCMNNKCDFEGGYCTDGSTIEEDITLPKFFYFLLILPLVFLVCSAVIVIKGDWYEGELQ